MTWIEKALIGATLVSLGMLAGGIMADFRDKPGLQSQSDVSSHRSAFVAVNRPPENQKRIEDAGEHGG